MTIPEIAKELLYMNGKKTRQQQRPSEHDLYEIVDGGLV